MRFTLFTATCHYCAKRIQTAENIFCLECYGRLPRTHYPMSTDNPVTAKLRGLTQVNQAGAMLYYHQDMMVQKLLYEVKYNANLDLGKRLGEIAGQTYLQEIADQIDLIATVPLHRHKFKIRGYNQSDHIAEGIGATTKVAVLTKILQRKTNTESQTRKSRQDRFQNVDSIFSLDSSAGIAGKHILLIDDVITTGATIASAANTLLSGNPASISIFTLAAAFEL